nr:immunoglobulin heavy chain junction region [Mus musculus]MBK4186446.1 immunoglobulin heavy chain junction region [Mus musculus]
CARETMDYW